MKKRLNEELKALANQILQLDANEDIAVMQYEARKLYEKLTALKIIEEKLGDIEIDVSKSVVADKFKTLANEVLAGNAKVPENNPHKEDIITPGIDTIKGMVAEMPKDEALENFLSEMAVQPSFEKKEKDILMAEPEVETKVVSLNDKLKRGISIGLNDKLAFIKHLFNGNTDDYNRVISQLNTMSTFQEAQEFIATMVKPDHNTWEEKEEFETRFMEIVESRFD